MDSLESNGVTAGNETSRVDTLQVTDLDPIPGMSAEDLLRFHILLLRHPEGIPVRMHRFEMGPTRYIKSAADVLRLVDGQRNHVLEQLIPFLREAIPSLGK